MIVINRYDLIKTNKYRTLSVLSHEHAICPLCKSELKLIGRRNRSIIDIDCCKWMLLLRRLKCKGCGTIHHELPSLIVPYKRYTIECIEKSLFSSSKNCVCAEESTFRRWKEWLKKLINSAKKDIKMSKVEKSNRFISNLWKRNCFDKKLCFQCLLRICRNTIYKNKPVLP